MLWWNRTIKRALGGECDFKFKYLGLHWSNWEGEFDQRFEKDKDIH